MNDLQFRVVFCLVLVSCTGGGSGSNESGEREVSGEEEEQEVGKVEKETRSQVRELEVLVQIVEMNLLQIVAAVLVALTEC